MKFIQLIPVQGYVARFVTEKGLFKQERICAIGLAESGKMCPLILMPDGYLTEPPEALEDAAFDRIVDTTR